MDFVINNYLIFIIIGVILLMALIGYIADNTNFEKKPKKPKKAKKGKQEPIVAAVEDPSMASTIGEQPVEASVENKTDDSVNADVVDSANASEEATASDNLMDAFEMPDEVSSEVVDSESADGQPTEVQPTEVVAPVEEVSEPSENSNENNNKEEEKKDSDDIWKF